MSTRLFPLIILALFALAAGRYAIAKDWWNVMYYGCAFGLNCAVLAMSAK